MPSPPAVPHGMPTLVLMLICDDAAAEMEFCRRSFDAVELNRRLGPDGRVVHGLLAIGEGMVMVESEWPGISSRPPDPEGGSPVVLYLYVADVDAAVSRAQAAGARLLMPVEDRFWGDRTGRIVDPAGHVWTVASRVQEPSADERSQRWNEIAGRVRPAVAEPSASDGSRN